MHIHNIFTLVPLRFASGTSESKPYVTCNNQNKCLKLLSAIDLTGQQGAKKVRVYIHFNNTFTFFFLIYPIAFPMCRVSFWDALFSFAPEFDFVKTWTIGLIFSFRYQFFVEKEWFQTEKYIWIKIAQLMSLFIWEGKTKLCIIIQYNLRWGLRLKLRYIFTCMYCRYMDTGLFVQIYSGFQFSCMLTLQIIDWLSWSKKGVFVSLTVFTQ